MSDDNIPERLFCENPPSRVPLLPPRKRSLTLPLENPSQPKSRSLFHRQKPQQTADQSRSTFFKLPLEVRELVYEHVLAPPGQVLHVTLNSKRRLLARNDERYVTSVPCYNKRHELFMWEHRCWTHKQDIKPGPIPHHTRCALGLGILRTCRQIYSEAIPLLYTHNTFSIRGDETIVNLPRVIPAHRFNTIRSLRFDTHTIQLGFDEIGYAASQWVLNFISLWKPAWDIIGTMKGLVKLRVTLDATWPWEPEYSLPWVLGPMAEVKVQDYEVVIYRSRAEDGGLDRALEGITERSPNVKFPFVLGIEEVPVR